MVRLVGGHGIACGVSGNIKRTSAITVYFVCSSVEYAMHLDLLCFHLFACLARWNGFVKIDALISN
jgi:hypothetical protein